MEAWRDRSLRLDPAGLAAFAVPLVLIVYLALSNGGFGPIARPVVGVAVWWTVLIGTAVNILPPAGRGLAGRALLVVAAAFAGWTALGMTWSESEERTATEVARVSTYVAVFALALAAQGAGRWRHVLHGVTAGVAVVCGIAVLSRMVPSWFPEDTTGRYIVGIAIESRLAYPLNYSSGLGALAAIGLPLLLAATASARSIAAQALAAAGIPIVALALWLTASGLSVPAAAVALVAFLVLAPDRLPKVATLAVASAGSALLFVAVEQREELDRALSGQLAEQQGDELLFIALGVCAAVGVVQAGLSLLVRHAGRPGWLQISRLRASIASAGVLAVVLAVALAVGAPAQVDDEWDQFKSRGQETDPRQSSKGAQLLDFSGSGRYDFWEAAVDANASAAWKGIGPGTFDLWWNRNGSYEAPVRDAHSLYLETLAELGIVGLVLIVGLCGGILLIGAWRALRAPPELRLGIAAATAGCAAFAAAALVDWVWEFGVLALIFFALAAVVCAAGAQARVGGPGRGRAVVLWRRHGGRIAVVALAVAGLIAIVQPLWGAIALERSYDAAAEGRLDDALDEARNAASAQPYAATPRIQEALLLERGGQPQAAVSAAREATEREPTNSLTWSVLAGIQARSGERDEAADARRRARELM